MRMFNTAMALALVPGVALAQNLGSGQTLETLINDRVLTLVNPVIFIITGLAFIFFLWGVAMFILNADNSEKRKEGRQKMFWGIIGLFVIFAVWGLVALVTNSIFGTGSLPGGPFN